MNYRKFTEQLFQPIVWVIGKKIIYKVQHYIIKLLYYLMGIGWGSETVSEELKQAKRILSNGKIFVDVGGNIGNYTNEIIKNFDIFRITPYGLIRVENYSESQEVFTTTNFLCTNKNLLN